MKDDVRGGGIRGLNPAKREAAGATGTVSQSSGRPPTTPLKGLIESSLLNGPFKKGLRGLGGFNSIILTSKCWFAHSLISNILVWKDPGVL